MFEHDSEFDFYEYINGVQEPLKNTIKECYEDIYGLSDGDFGLSSYLKSDIFKQNGVTNKNPKIPYGYFDDPQDVSDCQDLVNAFNNILKFTWIDENDDLKDLKEFKFSNGKTYEGLNLENKKIGNYDLNIIKHQQDRINSLCDKIKSREKEVSEVEAKKYFLIKFSLDVMQNSIERKIKLLGEQRNRFQKEMARMQKDIMYSSDYMDANSQEKLFCDHDQSINDVVYFFSMISNEYKGSKDMIDEFNISQQDLNKLSKDPDSIFNFDKDRLKEILNGSIMSKSDGLAMTLNQTNMQTILSDGYDIVSLVYQRFKTLVEVEIPRREWLTKFIKGEYKPDKDHEQIKKADKDFANFLKDTFNAEKLFKSFESDQRKKSLTAVQKLEAFASKDNEWSFNLIKINSIAKLCSFYYVNDYKDKIPEQSVAEKFNSLKEDAFKEVLIDINNGLDSNAVKEKIKVIEKFDSSQATFLRDMLELKEVLQSDESLDNKIKGLSNKYLPNIGLRFKLKKYETLCNKYGIEDKITLMFQTLKKEFLANFDLEKYASCVNGAQDETVMQYNDIEKIFGDDLARNLNDVAEIKEGLSNAQIKFRPDFTEMCLTRYINLYTETFKNDLGKLGKAGEEVYSILENLKTQIKANVDNPDVAKALAKSILFCIGTLCTGGILAFALFDENVRRTVIRPITTVKLFKIKSAYNEMIKNIQDLRKKINRKNGREV